MTLYHRDLSLIIALYQQCGGNYTYIPLYTARIGISFRYRFPRPIEETRFSANQWGMTNGNATFFSTGTNFARINYDI